MAIAYSPSIVISAISTTRILIAATTILLGLFCYRIFFHPLAKIPGPFLAKITGHWRNKRIWRGTWHDDILELHERYGRVVRIAPNEVAVVDQNAMKQLYGHGHNAEKTDWYATWDPPISAPAFFSVRDRKLHSFLRKRVSSAYSMTSILKYERPIQELLDLMIQKLRKHAEAGNVVDLDPWAGAFAFDVVGRLGYGAPLGHLEKDSEDVMGLRSNVLDLFFLSTCMGHYWGQMKIFHSRLTQKIFALLRKGNGLGELRDWSVARVQERFEEKEKEKDREHTDMLAHFMNMKKANGGPATFIEVLSESMNLM
jgi:cytochrome P450